MFNSVVLEVAIGLAFLYLLLALICTAVTEWLGETLRRRGRTLKASLTTLLGADAGEILGHPLIGRLVKRGRFPSYIGPRTFALALLSTLNEKPPPAGAEAGRASQETHPEPSSPPEVPNLHRLNDVELKKTLRAVLEDRSPEAVPAALAADARAAAQVKIEKWYESAMDRTSGQFRRWTQIIAFVVAVVITIAVNADTFQVANLLFRDTDLRLKVVAAAEQRSQMERPREPAAESAEPPDEALADSPSENPRFEIPLTEQEKELLAELTGWTADRRKWDEMRAAGLGWWEWLVWLLYTHTTGWLLTAVAVALGAPFWFDVLNKIFRLRATGRTPAEAREDEKKEKKS